MPQYYQAIDAFLKWTKEYDMKISIDYHHGKLTKENTTADVERICAIWKDVVTRYKDTDPERVFFEIFNEPNEINEEEWQKAAEKIIECLGPWQARGE